VTGLERMSVALGRGTPDRVPIWELIINQPVISSLHGDISYLDFVEVEDLDGLTIFEDQRFEELPGGLIRDEWGILWKSGPAGIPYPVQGPIGGEGDLDSYVPPPPDADWRFKSLREAVGRFKGEKAIVFLTHDAFEYSHYLRGMENLLMDYVTNPEFAHRLARLVIDYKKRVAEIAVDIGADFIVSGDDYAWRSAPIMSPAHFREFILPYLRELVDAVHGKGALFIKHTDGNIWPIIDMIVDAGIDALDPIEPIAGMDIGDVKARYGDRIALIGNVDCTRLLPSGSVSEVEEAVKETIAKASVGGGHVLASSNSIHPAVDPRNYKAMIEAGRRFGEYPLPTEMIECYRGKNYISKYLA